MTRLVLLFNPFILWSGRSRVEGWERKNTLLFSLLSRLISLKNENFCSLYQSSSGWLIRDDYIIIFFYFSFLRLWRLGFFIHVHVATFQMSPSLGSSEMMFRIAPDLVIAIKISTKIWNRCYQYQNKTISAISIF